MDDIRRPKVPQRNRVEEMLQERSFGPVPLARTLEPVSYEPEASRRADRSESYTKIVVRTILGLGIIALLIIVAFGGYAVFKARSAKPQAENVLDAVGKLIELPAGETPTVATITDLKPFANEPFFKNAAIGDKVIVYATSSEAILYRPSTNKVVNVAPLGKQGS